MRLIVFDMDGTLIDTHALISEHMTRTFTTHGVVVPPPDAMRRVIGLSLPLAIGRLAGSEDETLVTEMVETYKTGYRDTLPANEGREPLYEGALAAIDLIRAVPGTVLGIATGKGLNGVHRILATHGITDYFATLQTPDHNPSKPHPGMLLRAMAETGARPDEVVMIGDTSFDMELGRNAGVRRIGVTWGYHEREDLSAAEVLLDRYEDLPSTIDRLLE